MAARAVLGARLVQDAGPERRVGRIVEVEAYIGEDDHASHARAGLTQRTAPMFGAPGHAYVYLVYGMYDCLNIVTEPAGRPAALLVRAVEPVAGLDAMRAARLARAKRDTDRARLERRPAMRLASGPGLVCAAFSITRSDNGRDLCDAGSLLRLELGDVEGADIPIRTTPRIGVAYAPEPWASLPWRFLVADSPAISTAREPRAA